LLDQLQRSLASIEQLFARAVWSHTPDYDTKQLCGH